MTGWRDRLLTWEGFLLAVALVVFAANAALSPVFLTVPNLVNMVELSVEKVIVALIMAFVIINGEIDLSVASVMGLAACAFGWLHVEVGVPAWAAAGLCVGIGALCGAFNALWVVRAGLPSLVVTLATLIAFRGFARVLVEDRGLGGFPDWFDRLGQAPILGPFPLSLLLFTLLAVAAGVVLHRTAFGRKVAFIGASRAVAEYSGIDVGRVKATLFVASGTVSAVAGLLYAARVGAVRGDVALGFELDVITVVLLGGVSVFGGSGSIAGTVLAILIVLALRNGMALANVTGHLQTGVLGVLLILSVMVPTFREWGRLALRRRRPA